MKRNAWLGSLFWAASGGGIAAILTGEAQAVSLRVWLAGFASWFALATWRRVTIEVPLEVAKLQPLVRFESLLFWRRGGDARESAVRGRRHLEGLVLRSRENERAFVQQLQPRLVALAEHFLPVHHGIDLARQPDRAAELFGPLAWLIDRTVTNRSPRLEELAAFTDLLIPSSPRSGAEEAA